MSNMIVDCAHDKIVPIDELIENPKNRNKHPQKQIELLAKIMRTNKVRNPIVVSNRSGFMTKGHGRLAAAKLNGWTEFPVDYQDYESEALEYADVIADNKIAELAEHDDAGMIDDLSNAEWAKDLDCDLLGIPDFKILSSDLEVKPPDIPSGDRGGLKQITFTVTDEQDETIQQALRKAKDVGDFVETNNENSNGNAIARVCETYVTIS